MLGIHLPELQKFALENQHVDKSIVDTGLPALARTHLRKVRLLCDADEEQIQKAIEYISINTDISDVILASKEDSMKNFFRTNEIAEKLIVLNHVTAVRIRSLLFNYSHSIFNSSTINRLSKLVRFDYSNPTRIEIETQFIHNSEFKPEHELLANRLRQKGITVYNNTPLLGFINNVEEDMYLVSNSCRNAGIEYNHLYIAGLPIQNHWNVKHPIELSEVIDIASQIRRHGSGREVPRYIIATSLGEVDFGIMSRVFREPEKPTENTLLVKLSSYDLGTYKRMKSDFKWPKNSVEDNDGKRMIPVTGIMLPFSS